MDIGDHHATRRRIHIPALLMTTAAGTTLPRLDWWGRILKKFIIHRHERTAFRKSRDRNTVVV
jgi:hypothetical protein